MAIELLRDNVVVAIFNTGSDVQDLNTCHDYCIARTPLPAPMFFVSDTVTWSITYLPWASFWRKRYWQIRFVDESVSV